MENKDTNYININKVCKIVHKSFSDITASDWEEVQKLQNKLKSSSSFAHKYSKNAF